MKKLSIYSILTLFLVLVLSNACKKEEFTEEDAIKLINENALVADSIANAVFFTVKVVDASADFSFKSTSDAKDVAGLAGVTITVKSDTKTQTATTGPDGAATFPDLRKGAYSVKVELTGYTSVDFVATANGNGYFSVQIPVLSTAPAAMMTVTGAVTYETDLLNTAKEVAAGVKVMVDPDINNFFNASGISNFTYSGFTTSFTTDANGIYTATVPADKAGKLTYDISIPTVEVNQTLMLNTLNGAVASGPGNSAKTVATRFGTSMTSATSVPSVNSVYCVFGAPTHAITPAVLVAEIFDSKSFNSVHLNTSGKGYTNNARFVAKAPVGGSDAVFTIKTDDFGQNKVEYVTVTSGGSGFTSTTLDLALQQRAANFQVTAVAAGVITAIAPVPVGSDDGRGRYLTNVVGNFSPLTITSTGGTGASISIGSFQATDNFGIPINTITINNGGTGYVVGDKINIAIDAAKVTAATATGFLGGSQVTNIIVSNPGAGYPKSSTQTVKFSSGTATATATIDNTGRVSQVDVTGGGLNYTAAPTATVDYDLSNKTATASVYVNAGMVESVFGLDGGKGYDAIPTLLFYNQYLANNPAIAVNATVAINASSPFNVTSVTVNSTSVSNIGKNMAAANGAGPISGLKSVPGGKEFRNFYLGTGVRTAGE